MTSTEPVQPPTDEPDLTWDHELSKWVPAYRQTRWDHVAAEATSSTSLDQPGTGAGYTAVEPRTTEPVLGEEAARGQIAAIIAMSDDGTDMLDEIMSGPVAALIRAAEQRGAERAIERATAMLEKRGSTPFLAILLSSAREEGAAAERERIEKERERHARAALGLPPRPTGRPVVTAPPGAAETGERCPSCTHGCAYAEPGVGCCCANTGAASQPAPSYSKSGSREPEARLLLEEALHLCQHGERAPGCGPWPAETWLEWARRAEEWLRAEPVDAVPMEEAHMTTEIIAIVTGRPVAVEVGRGDTLLDVRRRACVTVGEDDGRRWEVRDAAGRLLDQTGSAVSDDGQPVLDRVFVNLPAGVWG